MKTTAFAVIIVSAAIAFATLPEAFATSINITREISAPVEMVWNIFQKLMMRPNIGPLLRK